MEHLAMDQRGRGTTVALTDAQLKEQLQHLPKKKDIAGVLGFATFTFLVLVVISIPMAVHTWHVVVEFWGW